MNDTWNPAICISAACLLWVNCMALYSIMNTGATGNIVFVTPLYATHSTLSIAELATLSYTLRDEAEKLRDAVCSSSMRAVTESYYRQAQLLYDAIDPERMCITGGGFFRLDRSLIVSISGALITYTVILSQTSHE
nr:uncharacterized protein LOC129388258 [Dermacentor andersoni]